MTCPRFCGATIWIPGTCLNDNLSKMAQPFYASSLLGDLDAKLLGDIDTKSLGNLDAKPFGSIDFDTDSGIGKAHKIFDFDNEVNITLPLSNGRYALRKFGENLAGALAY